MVMQNSGSWIEGIRTRAVGAVEDSVAERVAAISRLSTNPIVAGRRRVVKAVNDDVVALACGIRLAVIQQEQGI